MTLYPHYNRRRGDATNLCNRFNRYLCFCSCDLFPTWHSVYRRRVNNFPRPECFIASQSGVAAELKAPRLLTWRWHLLSRGRFCDAAENGTYLPICVYEPGRKKNCGVCASRGVTWRQRPTAEGDVFLCTNYVCEVNLFMRSRRASWQSINSRGTSRSLWGWIIMGLGKYWRSTTGYFTPTGFTGLIFWFWSESLSQWCQIFRMWCALL